MKNFASYLEQFKEDVRFFEKQIDLISDAIENKIRVLLNLWKEESQRTKTEDLIKLWESMGLIVEKEGEFEKDPQFLLNGYVRTVDDSETSPGVAELDFYLKKGDARLYTYEPVEEMTGSVVTRKGEPEERQVFLDRCSVEEILGIASVIVSSLEKFKEKLELIKEKKKEVKKKIATQAL